MTSRTIGSSQLDVLEAADWLEQLNPGSGQRFLAAVDATIARLEHFPRRGSRVDRAPRGRGIRGTFVQGYSFCLVYEVTANEVVIVSVTHARSKRQPWRRRI